MQAFTSIKYSFQEFCLDLGLIWKQFRTKDFLLSVPWVLCGTTGCMRRCHSTCCTGTGISHWCLIDNTKALKLWPRFFPTLPWSQLFVVTIKIYKLMSTLEYRIRAQSGAYKLEMLPKIIWEWSWHWEVKYGAGNTWRSDIAERDLGIRMDHKLLVRQQREVCVAEKPNLEPQPSLWDALPGAWQVCKLISLFSSVMRKPGWWAELWVLHFIEL